MPTQLYLTPADQGKAFTLEEFLSAASQEGFRYEIIHGRLAVSPIPDLPHDRLRKWLERLLDSYADRHPEVINAVHGPARVFVPDAGKGPSAPEPDLAAFANVPLDLPVEEVNWRDLTPVLVVEILSEDTADKDLKRNRWLYLRVPSIREYWIVDPRPSHDQPTLLVHRRAGSRWERVRRIGHGGTYSTPLLPDFTLLVDPHAGRPGGRGG